MTQLTITLPDELARQAEAYARAQGQSLPDMLENYLSQLIPVAGTLPELPPQLARLRGVIQLPPDANYKAVVEEEIQQRFGQ